MAVISALDTQTIISTAQTQSAEEQTAEQEAAENAEQQRINFLNILLTQLENQNPLDPMDTDQYTAQLTRFSQLEQQIETNEKLAVVQSSLAEETALSSFSYIGQGVEVNSNIGAAENGEAKWSYFVSDNAESVLLTVVNETGDIVHSEEGNALRGAYDFTLDTAQYNVSDGQSLTFFATALDSEGGIISTDTSSHLTVDGVLTQDGATFLTAGDIAFRLDGVLKVTGPSTTTNTQI